MVFLNLTCLNLGQSYLHILTIPVIYRILVEKISNFKQKHWVAWRQRGKCSLAKSRTLFEEKKRVKRGPRAWQRALWNSMKSANQSLFVCCPYNRPSHVCTQSEHETIYSCWGGKNTVNAQICLPKPQTQSSIKENVLA